MQQLIVAKMHDKIIILARSFTFVVRDYNHDKLRLEGNGLVESLNIGPSSVVRHLHDLGFAQHHSQAWRHLQQRVNKLLGGGSILGGVDQDPLVAVYHTPLKTKKSQIFGF